MDNNECIQSVGDKGGEGIEFEGIRGSWFIRGNILLVFFSWNRETFLLHSTKRENLRPQEQYFFQSLPTILAQWTNWENLGHRLLMDFTKNLDTVTSLNSHSVHIK